MSNSVDVALSKLVLREHQSASYPPRTFYNALKADVTIAFATDFRTAGEKLTAKAADGKILQLDINLKVIENARILYRFLKYRRKVEIINIAGNGIYTLSDVGWTQDDVNQYIYNVLYYIQPHFPIHTLISGGQTGVDHAGAVAGLAMGWNVEVMYPKRFIRRFDKQDVTSTDEELRLEFKRDVDTLFSRL